MQMYVRCVCSLVINLFYNSMHARWVTQTVELIDGQHPLTPAECCPSALAPRTVPLRVCIA